MTEFGSLALVEHEDDAASSKTLPGTRTGDLSERSFKPEVRVTQVAFSPTGREFAACSTEGLISRMKDVDVTLARIPYVHLPPIVSYHVLSRNPSFIPNP